ncbi:MAG: enoyl-CoA hydratase-related protein [Pseudomonadota bacterium]
MSIDLTRIDELALITLNRPQVHNALSYELLRKLGEILDAVEKSDARALIITGAGEKAFCAGADINELMGRSISDAYAGTLLGQQTFCRLDQLRIPSIALVNGYALGGGCELALACTFRLATPQARFGLPEIKLGLIPGYGGTQRLPRLIGLPMALEILMSGRFVDAEEAVRMGLANRMVARNPLDEALAYARQFSGHSLLTLRLVRDAAQRALSTPLADGLRIEAGLSTLSLESLDGKEGTRAFLEKRKPRFQDR